MDAGAPKASTDTVVLERMRLWIVGIIVLGLIGTMTELILLEHDEQALQFVPLVLMVLGAVTLAWYAAAKSTASLRALQIVMGLFVLSGFAGMVAHFTGSMEYQLELNPDLSAWELLDKIFHAKAPPLLAPGMMIQMGLLGLAYAYTDLRYRRSD
jgi:predicted membrane channel-forming protein YqfA (hemolysin III family)